MRLTGFQVFNFRSVIDSNWIDAENVTSLIGTNESGKSNILLPLWKLNPVASGEIDILADMPRSKYAEMKISPKSHIFIKARFELSDNESEEIKKIVPEEPIDSFKIFEVNRNYQGEKFFYFPEQKPIDIDVESIRTSINEWYKTNNISPDGQQQMSDQIYNEILELIIIPHNDLTSLIDNTILSMKQKYSQSIPTAIITDFTQRLQHIKERYLNRQLSNNVKILEWVDKNMPKFVYYSNYGNLDSQIRLSMVIAEMNRNDLTEKEKAKVRTLKTLFQFVGLKPTEIKTLGDESTTLPIDKIQHNKEERRALLDSAGSKLTKDFRTWWKQGNYVFRLFADGDYFRILVSDDTRPDEINLESRSTGLQWFFSFFLIFLNENMNQTSNTILLLDEPGVTLHPTSQKDLFSFFKNLAEKNQLIYTTHSPFMVDTDNLEQIRSVYMNKKGESVVSSDLRASEQEYGIGQTQSIFSVHAALGLTVSETLLVNCNPVLVEGRSDEIYLSSLKNLLISKGKIKPLKEIVFIPCGGTRGIKTTVQIITGKNSILPFVILDGDKPGTEKRKELERELYGDQKDRLIDISKFTQPEGEVEDLFPRSKIAEFADQLFFRKYDLEIEFRENISSALPLVEQITTFAKKQNVELPAKNVWKIKLAELVKKEIIRGKDAVISEQSAEFEIIEEIFKVIIA